MKLDTALIYAAGFGTRMGALTANIPKPILSLGEQTLIDHVIDNLAKGGIRQFHINTHYLGGQIVEHFADASHISIHDEPNGPYDTGGTLKSLAGQLPDLVLTANSDVLFMEESPAAVLREQWHDGLDALLLLVKKEMAVGHKGQGDFFVKDGRPVRRGAADNAPYVYSGAQIIRPHISQSVPKTVFSNNLIWDELIAQGRIGVAIYSGRCIDIGTKASLMDARSRLLELLP